MPDSLRKRVRVWLAYALYYSGFLWLLAAIKLRRRGVVLMYHRVLPQNSDTHSDETIVVSPQTFERQMRFLRRFFRPLSVDQLTALLERGERPPSRSCVVTFDDGWRDNLQYALPILRRTEVPATVFLAADFVGTDKCFWQERIARRMATALATAGAARDFILRHTEPGLETLEAATQRRRIRAAVSGMKRWPEERRQQFTQELEGLLDQTNAPHNESGEDRFLSWQEAAELTRDSPVSVGSHGCSHTPLPDLPRHVALEELREARRRIEAAVGAPIHSVAYPNGNFNDDIVGLAREAGYRIGFTTVQGAVGDRDPALALRRINVYEAVGRTMPEFLCTLLMVYQRLRRT